MLKDQYRVFFRGPTPAGPGVPKGVDGVGEEGMTRRQRSVDQQPSQDL